VGDIEGDGDEDIIAAARFDGTITWHLFPLGGGLGPFSVDTNFPRCLDLKVADLDRDGDLDVAGVSVVEDSVLWFENQDGNGTIWKRNEITLALNGSRSLDLADFDKDGDVDVVAAGGLADTIAWYENLGAGTNWAAHLLSVGLVDFPSGVFAADVDRDGDMDVVGTALRGDLVAWWSNPGNSIDPWPQHTVSISQDGATAPFAADYDRDGDVDIFALGRVESNVVWWANLDGMGTAWEERVLDGNFADPRSIDLGDIDLDGDLDVLVSSASQGALSWWTNNTPSLPGSIFESRSIVVETKYPRANGHAVGDFDCDGDLDLAAALNESHQIVWWENLNGEGTAWASSAVDTNFYRPVDLVAADVDQDG
jgi:hypothetical protein